ncbi:MAG: hypothetical protein HND44_10995 [Chloroflexi bacterium]|nr:hypothetical protein [Ardenticatenaceae bacterium]MBL1129005.1 hypothetical protein [Chloroflexota bacterium]NOG35084.1 hypothetical protein [Chloroflexota bacterium]GIK59058.1 MAG: hypothetical protein BroJett015_47210 [Chloroflexota bacterium]
MNNQSIIRYGGIAAIVSTVLYVVSMVFWMGAGTSGPPPLAQTLYVASQLIFFVTLVALYFIHRDESPTLVLVGVLVLVVSIVASLFIDPTDASNPVMPLLTLGYAVGALILGWLAYRSPKLTKGIGIAALITGVMSLFMVPFIVGGASADLVGMLNLGVTVPYLVWLVWLGVYFLQGKTAVPQSA